MMQSSCLNWSVNWKELILIFFENERMNIPFIKNEKQWMEAQTAIFSLCLLFVFSLNIFLPFSHFI